MIDVPLLPSFVIPLFSPGNKTTGDWLSLTIYFLSNRPRLGVLQGTGQSGPDYKGLGNLVLVVGVGYEFQVTVDDS